tara:strand:+ start:105 stop:761 length:657 start_codon:yes stop_codon:yes gene_type:complete
MISQSPPIFAGRDLRAGGTWFGVRPDGFFVALTNQPDDTASSPDRISRGTLVVELLAAADADSARRVLSKFKTNPYNRFNLLVGYPDDFFVAYGRDLITQDSVPVGLSILGNGRLNSPDLSKVSRARDLYRQRCLVEPPTHAMKAILADVFFTPDEDNTLSVRPPALDAICVRTPVYGTRSSALVTFGRRRVDSYLYADGPPDETPFEDVTGQIRPAQ